MINKKQRLKIGDFFGAGALRPVKVLKTPYFSLKIYKSRSPLSRFGVVLSKSLDKRATVRNKIKRAILAFASANKKTFMPADYLFLPSPKMTSLKRSEIIELLKSQMPNI